MLADTALPATEIRGSTMPRVGPPTPARSLSIEWEKVADELAIKPMPWQSYLARITDAVGPDDRWMFSEIAAVVSRQNGKTTFVVPYIIRRLAMGRRVLHAAQLRPLPRKTFEALVPEVQKRWPDARIRQAQGQEEIEIRNGGYYKITAAKSSSPRGIHGIDDLIVDELREISAEFIGAAIPTTLASRDPQILYLSNAGTEDSEALNSVRIRADSDPSLAYLEWSAAPDLAADDRTGWAQANPALGYTLRIETLEKLYLSAKLAGTLAHFETENLCRWVSTLRERLVDEFSWVRCRVEDTGPVRAPSLAVAMDPKGTRASMAAAWVRSDGTIGLRLLFDVTGDPIDTDRLGQDMKTAADRLGTRAVGFDPQTDKELVKYLATPKRKPHPVQGQEFANASAQFVNILTAVRLRWDNADAVTDDLTWTSRKVAGENGGYHAVRAQDDRPITASLAAIRAVWLASGPQPGRLRDAVR